MKETPGSRRDAPAPAARRDRPVRAVFLVGFMGAGKTSVGRALSRRLGWRFEDLDDRIRAREGLTIAQIFQRSGEASFRDSELAALRELLAQLDSGPPLIAALGGGAFVQREVAALLQKSGTVTVFLDAPVHELWRRCGADTVERPLRQEEAEFQRLYETRRPHYLKARMQFDTSGRPIDRIAREIAESLGLKPQVSSEEK